MTYFLQIIFLLILFLRWNNSNNCYKILVLLQLMSFAFAPLVANRVIFDSLLTYFNVIFCLLNLYLIIRPWRYARFDLIQVEDEGLYAFYKKILYAVLIFTIVNNLVVLICVRIYMPDIAVLKAQKGYKMLYDSIPYFGFFYRYTSVSRNLGLLALPICAYYIQKKSYKEAGKAFVLSLSSLLAALGSYSRAQLITYAMIIVCFYFYVKGSFPTEVNALARRIIKYLSIAIIIIFSAVTVSRFSSSTMSYYGDRIPSDSYIKNPIIYSVFEYSSSGFTNGVNQLELHESSDVLYGEPIAYDFLLMLSYFHLTSWTAEDYNQRVVNSYGKSGLNSGNEWDAFHGYTCRMVKAMGYFCTLIFDLLFYRYVRRKSLKSSISIKSLSVLTFLLMASVNSIYYMDYSAALYPLLFYIIISVTYSIMHHRIVIKREWTI